MSRFSVQRYTTKNDTNGNPRRVWVIRDEHGTIVATADEGYEGRIPAARALQALGAAMQENYLQHGWPLCWHHDDVTDLGDVDVSPGVYRRMIRYRIGDAT